MELACPHCLALNRVPDERLTDAPKCGQCGSLLLPGKPVDLNASNFDRFIAKAGLPVLVDFWADWCGPCKMMAPIFQQVAAEMGTRVRFAKVDTEANSQVSMRHHIKGIPSLILFKNGKEVARTSGAMEANALKRWLLTQGM
ncbi:MAG: thioredoxin [Hydrogenophilales bacterium RIFOXYD1_FULL_62_11]|nr:MAG: thioredoxin [Hydrogenophilales bacterium RIFOXYD1_FULL_62_11]